MTGLIIGLLIPFLGTVIGSSFVFFIKDTVPPRVQKTLMGFASGVMVAASVWSLLIPGMEINVEAGTRAVVPVVLGFLTGMAFLLLIDNLTPHIHPGDSSPEGPRSRLSRTSMLVLAVTIHNLPEGMAVGTVLAGSMQGEAGITVAAAVAMSVGIALQNIPEGAIVSMPLRAAGGSRLKAFFMGSMSGIVEPLGSVVVLLLASFIVPALPFLLAFAAGAMLYVVIEELIPEASQGEHSNLSTIGFAIGFSMMMVLDVVLG